MKKEEIELMDIQNKNRTWAEVNLANLEYNYRNICDRVHEISAETKVLSVVKADAYGHGAVEVAKRLSAIGTDYFAVATAPEAGKLRQAGIEEPILILGYVSEADIPYLIENHISATLCDEHTAEMFSKAAQAIGKPLHVHIAVNTGMTRVGFEADEDEDSIEKIVEAATMPGIVTEGIFTHFAVADTADGNEYTNEQFARFCAVVDALSARGLTLTYRHCANSGAILQYPQTVCLKLSNGEPAFTMVRAGIILYGYYPDAGTKKTVALRPVMTIKAHVVQVRDVKSGVTVSYGRTYTTQQPMRLAVITMGYADGYHRAASGRAQVMVNGKIVPVVGRICMDMCMIDVSGIEVKQGDIVTVFGEEGVTADTTAEAANTISYEVLCAISARMPRFYVN